jgi:hypothetical protein
MLRTGKAQSARQGTVLPETFDLRLDQQEIFEIDRSNLILQLRNIRRAINESAEEMEMVAIERVFVKSVSRALTGTARKLYQVAEDLNVLHRMIQRAHLPKEPERSNPKSRPRPRHKRQK